MKRTLTLVLLLALCAGCVTTSPQDFLDRQRTTIEERWRKLWGLPDPHAPEPGEPAQPSDPSAGAISGSGTFTWKPVSESNGKVAVLLPCTYRWHGSDTEKGKPGAIVMTRVWIRGGDRDGETLSAYQPLKNGQPGVNGNRIHARGKAPGDDYGEDFEVVATLGAGGEKAWKVKDGARRQG